MLCRHLGPVQMTADTAVIASKMILQDKKYLKDLKFSDKPSVKIAKKEYVEMPFRYIAKNGTNGEPMLPDGMLQHWKDEREMDFF